MDTEQLLARIRQVVREERGAVETRPFAVKFQEAARLLSVSEKHVGRMVKKGALITCEIDGVRRIPMSEIERLADPPPMKSSGATPARTRYDAAAAKRRLAELRNKR